MRVVNRRPEVGDRVQLRSGLLGPGMTAGEGDDQYDPSRMMGTVLRVNTPERGLSSGSAVAVIEWDSGSTGRSSLGLVRVLEEDAFRTAVYGSSRWVVDVNDPLVMHFDNGDTIATITTYPDGDGAFAVVEAGWDPGDFYSPPEAKYYGEQDFDSVEAAQEWVESIADRDDYH